MKKAYKNILVLLIVIIAAYLNTSGVAAKTAAMPTSTITPIPTPAPKFSSYEVFWPITAGRVTGDSLYGLKLFKEKLRGMVILNKNKKAEYMVKLSEKRLVEAEKLYIEKKDNTNAKKSMDQSIENLKEAIKIAKSKPAGISPETKAYILNSAGKQKQLLDNLASRVPESQDSAKAHAASLESITQGL